MIANKLITIACVLFLSWGNIACVPSTEPPKRPVINPPQSEVVAITDNLVAAAGATEKMRTKAAELRAATGTADGRLRSAVYVYSATVEEYAQKPEQLAARLALLGMSDVYLSMSREVLSQPSHEKREWYEKFIGTAHLYNIKVYAMRMQSNTIYTDEDVVKTEVESIRKWNSSVDATRKVDGISADLEPHTMKSSDKNAQTLGYWWDSTNNYGKGGSNDRLVGLTLDRLAYADQLLDELKLCEALFAAFQPKYNQGVLTRGCADDFLAVCDWVMVMAYRTTADKIWADVEHYLKAASANYKASVSVAVKVHQNELDSVSPSLKPLGWEGVLDVVKSVAERGKAWATFRGVDYFQYVGLEDLWEAE